jgi:hypothetical protein
VTGPPNALDGHHTGAANRMRNDRRLVVNRRRLFVRGRKRVVGARLVVRASDRLLELSHSLAELPPDLRDSPGTKNKEHHDQEKDDFGEADEATHEPRVAPGSSTSGN